MQDIRRDLEKVGLIVAYDLFANDTTRRVADIVLPGSLQEEDEGTVTTGEGRCVRLRNSVPPARCPVGATISACPGGPCSMRLPSVWE